MRADTDIGQEVTLQLYYFESSVIFLTVDGHEIVECTELHSTIAHLQVNGHIHILHLFSSGA